MDQKPKKKVNRGINHGFMGRPKIELDWEQFNKLCEIQCTLNEIAGWFNCSEDTIENRVQEEFGCTFSELRSKRSSKGRIGLRRKQMQTAMSGNVTMQIFLGKQYLGQSDKVESEHKGESKLIIDMGDDDKDVENDEVDPG